VSTIRTAHAFCTQHALASLYNVAIQKAYQAECRLAVAQGVGLGMFFFCIYAAYGLGEFDFLVCSPVQLIPAR
jgi:ATP-binding cassette, subfamily B (MDR/TAP), member 1